MHEATVNGRPAVAKRSEGADKEMANSGELAKAYLEVEAEINAALTTCAEPPAGFARFLGRELVDDEPWLLWERIGAPGAPAPTLADYAGGRVGALEADFGLSPRDVLRALLERAASLHALGFVHRVRSTLVPDNIWVA